MPADAALAPLLWQLLGLVILPLWLLAGVADYIAHARTDIAHTSGVPESALHLLQTAEIGIPLLALLFLEGNALVLALLVAGVVAHSVTAWLDIRYTAPRRRIPVGEQLVHGFLFVLPFVGLAIVAVLHWSSWQALLDPWAAPRGSWDLRLRTPPFDDAVFAAVIGASVLLGVVPGLVEFGRTLAARRRARPQ